MKDRQAVLSKRLQMLAEMVTRGNIVADMGCDHAFLSIYLVQKAVSPHVLAMDVRKGPLAAAREHIESAGLNTYIETRLSDGMEKLEIGEAETLVCAGMGGRLMERILRAHMDKTQSMRELILQPQSELKEFRRFLRREGFRILAEDAVYEEGKYYFAMKASYAGGMQSGGQNRADEQSRSDGKSRSGGQNRAGRKPGESVSDPSGQTDLQSIYDEYGELLLKIQHPVLRQYLQYRRETAGRILEKLEAEHTARAAERLSEVRRELTEIERASGWFET